MPIRLIVSGVVHASPFPQDGQDPSGYPPEMTFPCPHPPEDQRELFAARDYITGDSFLVCRCGRCGLARTVPQPPAGETDRYYPREYYGAGKRYFPLLEWGLDRLYAARARRLERESGAPAGRALDIGCGRGQLLYQLRTRGWTVIGTERSETSARYARDTLHLDVRPADIADLGLEPESVDAVILWHVLEHLPDPWAAIREIACLLRPGGTLLVAVPNFGSPEARWFRDAWLHLDVPRHVSHFDEPSLRRMLQAAGLVPERISYFAAEYDFFSIVQTALNAMGIRHNLLFDLLRARGARMLSERGQQATTREIAQTLALAPVLAVLSLLWVPLAARLRRGATMTVYAKKRPTRSSGAGHPV